MKIPVLEEYIPNVEFQVEVVGEELRKNDSDKLDDLAPHQTAFALGKFEISVPAVF